MRQFPWGVTYHLIWRARENKGEFQVKSQGMFGSTRKDGGGFEKVLFPLGLVFCKHLVLHLTRQLKYLCAFSKQINPWQIFHCCSCGMSHGMHFIHLLETIGACCLSILCQSTCLLQCWEAAGAGRGAGAGEVGWSLKSCGLTWWLQWLEFF